MRAPLGGSSRRRGSAQVHARSNLMCKVDDEAMSGDAAIALAHLSAGRSRRGCGGGGCCICGSCCSGAHVQVESADVQIGDVQVGYEVRLARLLRWWRGRCRAAGSNRGALQGRRRPDTQRPGCTDRGHGRGAGHEAGGQHGRWARRWWALQGEQPGACAKWAFVGSSPDSPRDEVWRRYSLICRWQFHSLKG